MTQFAPGRENGHDGRTDTELDARDARALSEYMTVLRIAPDVYSVTTQSGSEYTVDRRDGRCTCPDHKHNLPTEDGRETCKHQARVAFATSERPIPAWVDVDAVDSQLGMHVDGTPRVAATDGGQILDDESDDGRPDECDCGDWNADAELPCWPCYREGLETPADVDE